MKESSIPGATPSTSSLTTSADYQRRALALLNRDPQAFPGALRNLPNWVLWRFIYKPDGSKPGKKPWMIDNRPASSTNPETWTTFDKVHSADLKKAEAQGIGFVFDGKGIVGIDLDKCRNPETGEVEPWALEDVRRFNSWTEVSPTGTGLHIVVRGQLLPDRRNKSADKRREIYATGRFFTCTGHAFEGTTDVRDVGEDLARYHAEYFELKPSEPEPTTPTASAIVDVYQGEEPTRPPTDRLARRVRVYIDNAVRNEWSTVANTGDGNRNNAVNTAALSLARLLNSLDEPIVARALGAPIDKESVRALIESAGVSAGLPLDEVRRAVASGWKSAPAQQPRHAFVDMVRKWAQEEEENRSTQDDEDGGDITAEIVDDGSIAMQRDLFTEEWSPADVPTIHVGPDIGRVNDEALAALARMPKVFQRIGRLVTVTHDPDPGTTLRRQAESPRIAVIQRAHARELLSTGARWTKDDARRRTRVWCTPPGDYVDSLMARPTFEGVRPLAGFVESPTLRPDGTVIEAPGYDDRTGLYLDLRCHVPKVPEDPSVHDARTALAVLVELVGDFPFKADAHRAAWVAALLTSLARHAFDGPAPAFLVDANASGAGKTKLCDLVSIIATGREAPRMTAPKSDDEARKAITATALSGDPIVLVDNIAGVFGGQTWDAALTGTVWKDRLLGRNDGDASVTVPLRITWLASGNNVMLRGDLHRRIAHIRLESPLEAPDARDDFKHPDLLGHARRERGRIIQAALTILRAYFAAGCPDQRLPAWGSFEAWSKLCLLYTSDAADE